MASWPRRAVRRQWKPCLRFKSSTTKDYGSTLLLPNTKIPTRAQASEREIKFQDAICKDLYEWQSEHYSGFPKFTLHDGPPYANGDLHMGHALNKILKDFVNRHMLLKGHQIDFVPGWDCHGLPIELRAMQGKAAEQMSPLSLRKRAGNFALDTMIKQRSEMMRWGILADWSNSYKSMDKEYEAAQLRVFMKMVDCGLIYRDFKPVHWSPSSTTALAEAELEYEENHISRAVYVQLPMVLPEGKHSQRTLHKDVKFLIWTTTPWSLPANEAIAYGESIRYAQVRMKPREFRMNNPSRGEQEYIFLIAEDRIRDLADFLEADAEIIGDVFEGKELSAYMYQHPFEQRMCPMISGHHVTATEGTGLVHIAPAHGIDDFQIGKARGLRVSEMVNETGKFTAEAALGELEDLDIHSDGIEKILDMLHRSRYLVKDYGYKHRYPYDWRTKKPVIQRATKQWFTNLDQIQEAALRALDDVKQVPSTGNERMRAMLGTRKEWCISRQRHWGVPIPVFYDIKTDEPLIDQKVMEKVVREISEYGSDCWWSKDVDYFLGAGASNIYRKGMDTLDVWFDSGVSWASVLQQRGMSCPSDMVIEGSDQHRGWFQSSLLTSIASQESFEDLSEIAAPYKTIVTHGFVLDEKNRKMSKSLGNIISPRDIIGDGSSSTEKGKSLGEGQKKKGKKRKRAKAEVRDLGADVVRLWVASSDYTQDICVGPEILGRSSAQYRKFRNVLRFIAGCLNDWDCAPSVHHEQGDDVIMRFVEITGESSEGVLSLSDKYMLHLLQRFCREVDQSFENLAFTQAIAHVMFFINSKLSAGYLDSAKDRLYADYKTSHHRRTTQYVLTMILENLLKSLAPITPHLSQEVYTFLPEHVISGFNECPVMMSYEFDSVFTHGWLRSESWWESNEAERDMQIIEQLSEEANRALEMAREAKVIKGSLDASVYIVSENKGLIDLLHGLQPNRELPSLLKTSQVILEESTSNISNFDELQFRREASITLNDLDMNADVTVIASKASGHKCARCWNWGELSEGLDVCPRCNHVLSLQ